jgi:hypothetical protein
MITSEEIRDRVRDLVDGRVSVRQFQIWFASSTWDAHLTNDSVAREILSKIDLSLSEYSGGYLPLDLLMEDLKNFAGLRPANSEWRPERRPAPVYKSVELVPATIAQQDWRPIEFPVFSLPAEQFAVL